VLWGLTLGHGLVAGPKTSEDIRNHPFYGDYKVVAGSLDSLPRDDNGMPVTVNVAGDHSDLVNGSMGSKDSVAEVLGK
jgi:hypothetical protein